MAESIYNTYIGHKNKKISSSMLDQVVSERKCKKYSKYKTLEELIVFNINVYQIC